MRGVVPVSLTSPHSLTTSPVSSSTCISVSLVLVIRKSQRNMVSHIPASLASSRLGWPWDPEGATYGSKSPGLESRDEIQVPLLAHICLLESLISHGSDAHCPRGCWENHMRWSMTRGHSGLSLGSTLHTPSGPWSLLPSLLQKGTQDFHPSGTPGSNQTPSGWVEGSSHLPESLGGVLI